MKYYISTIQDCEDIKKLQDYLLVISDEYYDNLSNAQKAKCEDELTVELIEL